MLLKELIEQPFESNTTIYKGQAVSFGTTYLYITLTLERCQLLKEKLHKEKLLTEKLLKELLEESPKSPEESSRSLSNSLSRRCSRSCTQRAALNEELLKVPLGAGYNLIEMSLFLGD